MADPVYSLRKGVVMEVSSQENGFVGLRNVNPKANDISVFILDENDHRIIVTFLYFAE